MQIGWIGAPMVRRLLAAGFPVTVHERGQGLEQVRANGAAMTAAAASGLDVEAFAETARYFRPSDKR